MFDSWRKWWPTSLKTNFTKSTALKCHFPPLFSGRPDFTVKTLFVFFFLVFCAVHKQPNGHGLPVDSNSPTTVSSVLWREGVREAWDVVESGISPLLHSLPSSLLPSSPMPTPPSLHLYLSLHTDWQLHSVLENVKQIFKLSLTKLKK